ncbi:aminotransferase class IV [Gemmata sp. JC717]|uniref:aminotransferase class IV n=1 Tax=Gemmata algarum TaxID=2975278 RepID=UPI0021BAEDC2|nr:aminotransferase class IV [Gemmata algarum]MDY3554353.1 aminotransferase class IV [Gemmata algarum]
MSLVWVNGTLVDKLDARVSPFDHGFLYGDGVWEHLRVFGGALFRAPEHFATLAKAAGALAIDVPLSPAELLAAVEATVRANGRTEGYVRVLVTRGPGTIGPDPRKLEPQVLITAEEYQPFPQELYGHGLHAVVSPQRLDADNPAHQFRTLNQLHVVRAKQHALRHGCLESLLQNRNCEIVGATEGVLFAVKGDLLTLASGAAWDDTGAAVIDSTADRLALVEDPLRLEQLLAADEVFVAGTACGVIGVVRIDGTDIGRGIEGPVTRTVREAYARITQSGLK